MTSAAVTINIPIFQLTNPEKAILATALTLLVASQVFPQLSTSFGWVSECGPISLVLGTALAGAALIRAHERRTSQVLTAFSDTNQPAALKTSWANVTIPKPTVTQMAVVSKALNAPMLIRRITP